MKKLVEGEGLWETKKELLGWIFDGVERCIELPAKKNKIITSGIKQAVRQKGIKFKDYEKLLGKLRHATIGVPGSKGLFTPLNRVLSRKAKWICFHKHHEVAQALKDFRTLLLASSKMPTHVRELVPGVPDYVGHCDACVVGAGGVWHSGTDPLNPTVWRVRWTQKIKEKFITTSNPHGTLSISDLEMAGLLIHYMVLESFMQLRHKHIGAYCDNTPTVSWAYKFASKRSIIGGRLLRILALRQLISRSSPLLTVSIAGATNNMADVSSRSFNGGKNKTWIHESDDDFLRSFNVLFPLPQTNSWQMLRLPEELITRVISELLGERLTLASWMRLPQKEPSIGRIGKNTRVDWEYVRTSINGPSHTSSGSSSCAVSLAGSGQGITALDAVSGFKRFKSRFAPSERRVKWNGATTQLIGPQENTSTR